MQLIGGIHVKKRLKNKLNKKARQSIPVGYGIITGNGTYNDMFIQHHHPIGTLVKIYLIDSSGDVDCTDSNSGLPQTVSKEHVLVGELV